MVRVAVNVEQLLHEAPGGIGRYTAELVRLLPGLGVDVTAFTARHSRADVDRALHAQALDDVRPVILPLPAAVLYDAWHVLGVAGPVRRVAPVDLVHAPSPAVPPTARVPLVVTVHDAAAARDAGGVHPPGGHVPPAGLRRRGAACPSGDRGVGVQRRRDRDAHGDPP